MTEQHQAPRWDYDPADFRDVDVDHVPFTLVECQVCGAYIGPHPWDAEKHSKWHQRRAWIEAT